MEHKSQMGIVVVGGLLFSLILTLYVIPAMYTYISSGKNMEMNKNMIAGSGNHGLCFSK